jgi:hypothetical protein
MAFFRIFSFVSLLLLLISCASKPPVTFVEAQEEGGAWKVIHLHNNYGLFRKKNQEVWNRVTDVLSKREYRLEERDATSGYIRTSWKNLLPTEDNDKQYRSRIIVKMLGRIWHTAQIKVVVQWWDDGSDAWISGYDSALIEDIYNDLQGRIGSSVR